VVVLLEGRPSQGGVGGGFLFGGGVCFIVFFFCWSSLRGGGVGGVGIRLPPTNKLHHPALNLKFPKLCLCCVGGRGRGGLGGGGLVLK